MGLGFAASGPSSHQVRHCGPLRSSSGVHCHLLPAEAQTGLITYCLGAKPGGPRTLSTPGRERCPTFTASQALPAVQALLPVPCWGSACTPGWPEPRRYRLLDPTRMGWGGVGWGGVGSGQGCLSLLGLQPAVIWGPWATLRTCWCRPTQPKCSRVPQHPSAVPSLPGAQLGRLECELSLPGAGLPGWLVGAGLPQLAGGPRGHLVPALWMCPCRGPAPADPGYSKERRLGEGKGITA